MRKSKVLSKIRSGKVARICSMGSFIPSFPRIAAHFGYDGIWVDGEHRAFDPREAQSLIALHHLADIDCIWRASTLEKTGLYRLLEDGAAGIMLRDVSTAEKAKALVQAVKFPPVGDRGLDSAGLDADFLVSLPNYDTQQVNRETCLVVQIETPEAVDNAEAIAAVPGVDVLFIGPGDLSLRYGGSPAMSDPKMIATNEKIASVCKKHGKAWGRPVGTTDDARLLQKMGGQFIVLGSEFWGIYSHLRDAAAQLDSALGGCSVSVAEKTEKTVVP